MPSKWDTWFCGSRLTRNNHTEHLISGVARVPCALGQEIFLRPLLTKLTKFELKNRYKSAEEGKAEICSSYLVLFPRNKMHLALETNSTKL